MLTRKLTSLIASGLVLGLLGQSAAATEEVVVVYGGSAAREALASEVRFQSEMREYVESMDRVVRADLDKRVQRIKAPSIELALVDAPTRG